MPSASSPATLPPSPPFHAASAPGAVDVPRKRTSRRLAAWLREPLLHFVVLGGLLFAIDHALLARSDDPRQIVLDATIDREARQVFQAARGHEPSADELVALRKVWLDNEVLYREGLALQVDKGDTAIRERVIFKALSVIDANLKLPPFDDVLLRRWFEEHRIKYDEPARFDFLEAVLSGDSSESAVRSFVAALNAGAPGDAQAGLRVFKGRPHANLMQSYGPRFAEALENARPGDWRALQGKDDWRAVRLEATTPAKPAAFEPLRNVVLQDWTDAVMSAQRSAAVQVLARKYTIDTPTDAGR